MPERPDREPQSPEPDVENPTSEELDVEGPNESLPAHPPSEREGEGSEEEPSAGDRRPV